MLNLIRNWYYCYKVKKLYEYTLIYHYQNYMIQNDNFDIEIILTMIVRPESGRRFVEKYVFLQTNDSIRSHTSKKIITGKLANNH